MKKKLLNLILEEEIFEDLKKDAYKEGLKNINNLIQSCIDIKLPYLTLFTLSSENIKRNTIGSIFQVIYDDFSFFF